MELTAEHFHELEEHGMEDGDLDHLRLYGLHQLGRMSDRGFLVLMTNLMIWHMREG